MKSFNLCFAVAGLDVKFEAAVSAVSCFNVSAGCGVMEHQLFQSDLLAALPRRQRRAPLLLDRSHQAVEAMRTGAGKSLEVRWCTGGWTSVAAPAWSRTCTSPGGSSRRPPPVCRPYRWAPCHGTPPRPPQRCIAQWARCLDDLVLLGPDLLVKWLKLSHLVTWLPYLHSFAALLARLPWQTRCSLPDW